MSKQKMKEDGSLYFRQTDTLPVISLIMMVVGIVFVWIRIGYVGFILAGVLVPVGLVLFFISNSKRVSQNDLEEERDHLLRDYDDAVTRMDKYDRIVLRQPADVQTAAYSLGEDAKYFKRGKNNALITDVYVKTHFFFTKDGVMYTSRAVCLSGMDAEKGEGVTDKTGTLYFSDMTGASLDEHTVTVTLTNTEKPSTARWTEMVIAGKEGELLRLPVNSDMDVSSLCDEINRRIK